MRSLTKKEEDAIREEVERIGDLDGAIRFCLGYQSIIAWSDDMHRTFEEVKKLCTQL